ncbi:MAG: c-type cytochrome [Planctomycetota bacterium]|nr:c-type cytochrome [Planctomycetota bacterium]
MRPIPPLAVAALLVSCSGIDPKPARESTPAVKAPPEDARAPVEDSAVADAPPPRATKAAPTTPPQWIWNSPDPGELDAVVLERRFDVPRPVARATLRASGDNRVRVFLNGELVGKHGDWSDALVVEVGPQVRRGENVLSLIARNEGGAAGAWAELVVEDPSSRRVRVATDASWTAAPLREGASFGESKPEDLDPARIGPAHAFGPLGVEPWSSAISEARVAEPASQQAPVQAALAASAIELQPGFRAELVHEVQLASEGSWVSMCEDPRGRLYVSDQHGRLFRVTPNPVGASASETRVEPVALEIGSAHGLCWAFDALYVVVSESDPGRVCGLYRLRDTNGDDQLDTSELLRDLRGSGEHGPHAVRLGPDGALWVIAGNHTDLPEPLDASRLPRTWAEDLLLPRIDDPRGHAVGRMAPGGWIARTDENGAHWEIVVGGFRNAYDIAFDPRGELFTFDSDMEWDVGAPWYRPTRILHAASGADFGWRNGSGKWPAYSIDTWPSACDMGRGSPTGVEFGTQAKFPERWRRALYACDWTYGTIHAVQLVPDGASWRGTAEVFARGKPFQVTDVLVTSDGAMYVTTGGRNTRSALYRIRWEGPLAGEAPAAERLGIAQKRRRELEALHVAAVRDPADLVEIARGLSSHDRFLAGAAGIALEFTPAAQWEKIWSSGTSPRASSRIVLAALHAGHQDPARILAALDRLFDVQDSEIPPTDTLRLVQLALLRLEVPAELKSRFCERVGPLLASADEGTARQAAIVLAYLDAPGIATQLLARIDASTTQEDAIHFAYCLRVVKSGWTQELRERFLDFLGGRAAMFRGGESLALYVTRIREDFVSRLGESERAALASRLGAAKPVSAAAVAPAAFVRRWTRPELEKILADPARAGSFEPGREAFAKATCVACHRIGDAGGSTGPDLTTNASRFGLADMLDAILEPAKTISDQYRDVEFRTTDGDLLVGRVEGERDGVIRLRRAPSDELVEIAESDVEMRRPYPLSRMPSGLLDSLDEEGVLDLFAYLRSGGMAPRSAGGR